MINFFLMGRHWFFLIILFSFHCAESAPFKPLVRSYKCRLPIDEKPLIIVDPGHGGMDPGARVQYFAEKNINLTTALLVRKHLDALGCRVMLTRNKDVFIPLKQRALFANKIKAVLFVSIHFNACRSPQVHGVEIYYYKNGDQSRQGQSYQLGDDVLKEVIAQTKAISRGVKHGNFCIVRETHMPAILVEGGFMTNSGERGLLKDKRYLEKIAKGIALGVDKYLNSYNGKRSRRDLNARPAA